MASSSSSELFEVLEKGDLDSINQAITISIEEGCKETATTVKTKAFRKGYGTTGKDYWEKYIIPNNKSYLCFSSTPPANYIEHMGIVRGIQYTVTNIAPLIYVSNINSIDQSKFESLLNLYSSNVIAMKSQYYEVINVSVGWCYAKNEYFVYSGTRTLYPPIYQATQVVNNSIAIKALLQTEKKHTTDMTIVPIFGNNTEADEDAARTFRYRYDPTERPVQYKLEKISINKNHLVNLGGGSFDGYHKMKYSNLPETSTTGVKSSLLRDHSFAGLEIDTSKTNVDEECIPAWRTVECVWREDTTVVLPSPLEAAYQTGNEAAIQLLLQDPLVCTATTLQLRDTHQKYLEITLQSMSSLTSLKLESTGSGGSVPECVFRLKTLRHLDLRGSDFVHIPDTVAELTALEELNVSGLALQSLPVIALGKLDNLHSVDCSGIKLASPPPEIVKQGPVAVAQYILALGEGAERNTDVLLMLIGDGEAGKTSLLQALKNNATNCAGTIGVDDRTVGIDISSFQPHPEKPLKFFAWDFGGQGIYAIMQQLFVSRRALYPLLWRVRQSLDMSCVDPAIRCDVCKKHLTARPGETQQPVYRVKGQGLCHSQCVSYEPLISSWTERLQFRVPGVSMILIATHIDCATPEEVEEQCAAVTRVVECIQARQAYTMEGIAPVRFCNNGQSLRVNNMTGEGIAELREKLIEIAQELDFYGEVIPASYVRLRQKLREMQRKGDPAWRTWLLHNEYASIAKECGLSDATALQLATQFLHDVGELRYFSHSDTVSKESSTAAEVDDSDSEDDNPYKGGATFKYYHSDDEVPAVVEQSEKIDTTRSSEGDNSAMLLSNTVFPNPFWIVDVLRGLIRHDHSSVLAMIKQDTELSNKNRRTLRRRVYRLMQRGFLHESLLQYVWRGVAGMSESVTSNADEFARLIALMKAFDILMDKPGETFGAEWIVPTLAAGKHSHTAESDAFIDDSLPFVVRLVYDALPPYFDMMLVAHVINRRIADSVDFIGGAAAFHKLAERALLFAGLGKVRHPGSVFRRDQLCEERFQKVLRDDQCHVVIAASSRQLMLQLMEEVSSMNAFFPGLRRLCALFPCYSCRMKRIQLKQSAQLLNPPVQTTVIEDSNTAPLALCTNITDGTQLLEAAESADIVSQDYLSSALQADSMNCGSYFVHNQAVLQPALLKYDALNALLGLEKDEEVAVNFNEDSVFGKVYGAETPRLFQEALTVMMRLKTIIAPTAEDGLVPSSVVAEETPSVELENCLKAVAERQYNIAFQQAGAELPTLRTITKYCSKHVDALFIAWEVCPELEVLCSSLNSALHDSAEAGGSGKGLTASELSREDAAPEYMHLLRSAVELVHTQQRPQSPNKETSTAADACKELLIDRALDITLLREQFPALVEFEQTTLASSYGGSSTVDAQAAQYRLLAAIFHCLDTALHASEETLTNLESDKKAVSDLRELIIDGVDIPALQNWYPKQLQCWIGRRLKHYIPSKYEEIFYDRFEFNREVLEIQRFIHKLEAVLTTLHLTITDTALKKFTILEPTFDINTYSTIKEAFIVYAKQHQLQLTLLAEVMEIASEKKLEQFSNLFYYERNLFDEFFISTRCKQSLENAEYSLMFWIVALFLKSIEQASQQKPTLSKAFEKANTELLITEDAKTISFTELKELWDYNIETIHLAKSKMSIIESLFPEYEELSEIEFCDDPESFHLNQCWDRDNNIGSRKKKFHHIPAAYMILKEFLSKMANWNPICKSVAEQSKKMRDWEKLYPVSTTNSDELENRYEELKKDNSMHMIGLKLAFNHREIAISLLETFSSSVLDKMENNVMEVIRTWEYLKEGHDVLLLPDLIKERIADHEILIKLLEQCDFSNDNLIELTLFIEEIMNKRKQLAAYREEIALLVKEEFNPWLEIQETLKSLSNDRNTCMQTTVEDFKTRHECSQYVHTLKCTVITEQNENIKNIIIKAQEEAMKWKESRLNIAAALKEGPLRAELLEVVNLAKRGIATYNQLRTYRENITSNKVEELVKVTKERLTAYHQLMCLRDSYGPPWYFGAGRREAVPHPDTTCSIDVDCLAREKWCNDMEYFISAKGLATECMCPGEAAALTDPNLSVCAQPAQSCAIYISHSKKSHKFAEKLALAMEDAGVSRQSIRIDPDKYPELLIGDIVRFNPSGESITDCTEHSLLTGIVIEVNESTREVTVRTIDPCYQSTYRGLSPVAYTLDIRRSEKNRQLIALSKAVGKNHFHLRDARGCIVQVDTVSTDIPTDRMYVSIPGGERQVSIVELKLGEAPSREDIGAAVTDDLMLFRLLKLLPGYPVIVRIDGMEVHGTVSEEPLTVSYESAPGVTVTEVLNDRKRVIMPPPSDAVAEANVMLCLIDAAYADSDRCRVEFLRAQAHGLGVIPVILADYEVTNYQQWWPKQMPTMAKHSLFVDMRNLSATAPAVMALLHCMSYWCVRCFCRTAGARWSVLTAPLTPPSGSLTHCRDQGSVTAATAFGRGTSSGIRHSVWYWR